MIEIKGLNKIQLIEFIYTEEFNLMEFIPISKHRAISHSKNPRLSEDDILLFLAYEEKKMIGYLGVLPDKIWIQNSFEKCGWLSCLWIDPKQRGKKIAQQLLSKCFEIWEEKILVTEFTPAAKNLYDKSKIFHTLQQKKGIRLYIRSDLNKLLPPKKYFFSKVKFLLKAIDFIANLFLDIRFLFIKKSLGELKIEQISSMDDETINFILPKQEKELFKRGKYEFDWILSNPWILSSPENSESRRYHFSSVDKSFEFIALKVFNSSNQLIAFLIFSKRNRSLKIPYCYYEKDHIKTVIKIIDYYILTLKINTFTTFHPEISDYLIKNKIMTLYKKEIKRNYIISKIFGDSIFKEQFEIQDGDADCSFT